MYDKKIKELEDMIHEHDILVKNILLSGLWSSEQMDYKVIQARNNNIDKVLTQKLTELKEAKREAEAFAQTKTK